MSRTKMTTLAFILSELFPLDDFRYHDTSQLSRTGHDDVSRTRMKTLILILSELFSLDC